MKRNLAAIFLNLLLFVFSAEGQAFLKGWHGIIVFETSRATVEKRFGLPAKVTDDWHIYENDEFRVSVLYAIGPCTSPKSMLGGFNVEKDTVIEFDVSPKKPLRTRSLGWDLSDFEWIPDKHRARFGSYLNRTRAIQLVVRIDESPSEEHFVDIIYFRRPPDALKKKACTNE